LKFKKGRSKGGGEERGMVLKGYSLNVAAKELDRWEVNDSYMDLVIICHACPPT